IVGAEPGGDSFRRDAETVHHLGQRGQRGVGKLGRVLASGETLFLVIADDAQTAAGADFDQRDAAVVEAADADAGEISGLAAGKRVAQRLPPLRGETTVRPMNVLELKETCCQRQRKLRPDYAQPWML